MTIRFRSPVTVELRPKRADGVPRPPDTDAFYVTQRFDDIDFYWQSRGITRTHKATDIGNARCNYPIVAMAPGNGRRVTDNAMALGAPSNALGYIIDHGDGVSSEYWHLNAWNMPNGPVAAGQQIGIVGSTGLGGVCHCHIELKINGIRIDPEPYMFGKVYETGDDMRIPAGLRPFAQAVLAGGNNMRDPLAPETVARKMDRDRYVAIYGDKVAGPVYNLGDGERDDYCLIGVFGEMYLVARPLLDKIEPTGFADDLPGGQAAAILDQVRKLVA